MNLKDKISLDKVFEKEYKVKLVELKNNKEAVITHFLHNSKNGVSQIFKKDAIKYTKEILQYEYPTEEISNIVAEEALQYGIFDTFEIPFPPVENPKFKFIDLFAGIGGFRLAMQNLEGRCVFTSEWDKDAKRTYKANFGERPFGDITKEEIKAFIPDNFDLLCAGFPCQAFSIAGKRGGFEDTRGTLFFDVAEIIKRKQPKAIFLETQIINAKDFGVPQNRERIYIVGFHPSTNVKEFSYPKPLDKKITFGDIKEKKVPATKYFLSTQYVQTLVNHKARHEGKGNGFGYAIISDNEIANAVVCGGMGRERNLVLDHRITDFTPTTHIKGTVNREGIRKMTPREWARLQGFPDDFLIPVADASAYKQFGNSVAVPAIQATAKEILKLINKL